jgi:hypothetical protein
MATVCEWFDLKTTRTVFAGLALKPVATVFSNLASKLVVTVSPGLASKTVVVSWLSLKTEVVEGFPVWVSKPIALVWEFGPQNHGDSFLVWSSKLSRL